MRTLRVRKSSISLCQSSGYFPVNSLPFPLFGLILSQLPSLYLNKPHPLPYLSSSYLITSSVLGPPGAGV